MTSLTAADPDRPDGLSLHGLALVVVDVQRGFDDAAHWGRRDNPACEANVARLLAAWRAGSRPVVLVRHDSADPASPLRPGRGGNAFEDVITGEGDLLVAKSTNSCFYGAPDLHAWLLGRGLRGIVLCGITTNHCCETTARMGGNLGLDVLFVLDATHTFDRAAPDGAVVSAEELSRVSATNLHGELATVVATDEVVAASTS